MINYFVGVLLDASKNRDNKLEWTEKNGSCYYRIGGFNSKWDFKKANKLPCKAAVFTMIVGKAKNEMRRRGLTVPGVFKSHKIDKKPNK